MKIVIDAMGGDHAPMEIVSGALEAAAEGELDLILTGRGEELLRCMAEMGFGTLPKNVEIGDAPEVVTMDDAASSILGDKKQSSMAAALRMLKDGAADAMVSAGNTGALLTGAASFLEPVEGVQQAALAASIPARDGELLLVDAGATTEASPEMLLQFGKMGAAYLRRAMYQKEPRVGILNIGTEAFRGTFQQREAYGLLQRQKELGRLNFVGNVDARDALLGGCDVLVTDGFTGSVLMKGLEGMSLLMLEQLHTQLDRRAVSRFAGRLAGRELSDLEQTFDPVQNGGCVLLGVTKPVVRAHSAVDAGGIKHAVHLAARLAKAGIATEIARELSLGQEG